MSVCIELYQQAEYKETEDGHFDVVNADTSELVTVLLLYLHL